MLNNTMVKRTLAVIATMEFSSIDGNISSHYKTWLWRWCPSVCGQHLQTILLHVEYVNKLRDNIFCTLRVA